MLEVRRQLVHATGIFIILIIAWFSKYVAALLSLLIVFLFFILSRHRQKLKPLLNKFERRGEIFKGAMNFYIGTFLTTLIFNETAAIAGIVVLSIGDSISTLVGKHFGKHKIANGKKTIEGSTGFFLSSILMLYFLTNPLKAVAVAFTATIIELLPLDDNLTIPVFTALVFQFLP